METHSRMKSISVHQCYQWFKTVVLISTALTVVHQVVQAADKPNVLILFTDDQGTLDAGCYGATDLQTPNIDKLAETGVMFTQAYAHAVCCPSRAALLTGRHPNRGGVQTWLQGDRNGADSHLGNMFPSEITMAEVFKEAGYKTALFGKWHLGAKVGHGPLDQGFDRHFGHLSGFIENYRHHFMHGKGYHDLYDDNEEIWRPEEYFPEMIVDEAMKYIDENKEDPFFVMVSFNLPHYPEQPEEKFKDAFANLEMPRRSYARVMATVDNHIGRILAQLDASGIRENTLVIFSSDNGHSEENNNGVSVDNHTSGYPKGYYYLANGGGGYTGKWIGHKGEFLEGGVRVPMIVNYPKALPSGETRDQVVTLMDWMPTLVDLIGLPKPDAYLDGRSMISIFNNPTAPTQHPILYFDWQDKWAVREGDWKLISLVNRQTKERSFTLHNLAEENPEVRDHADEQPALVAHLKQLYTTWKEDVMP